VHLCPCCPGDVIRRLPLGEIRQYGRLFAVVKELIEWALESACQLLQCFDGRNSVAFSDTRSRVPLYQLFYDGEEPPVLPNLPKRKSSDDIAWGSMGKDARFLNKLRRLLGKVEEGDRKLILYMAQKMAGR